MASEQGITHQLETSNIGKTKLSTSLLVSEDFGFKNGSDSSEADFVSRPTAWKMSNKKPAC